MTDYTKLRELAMAATPGPWWIDSHGHCMVAMREGHPTIFVTNTEAMGPAVRHTDTGNLSHWRNDNDASYIAAASPDVVLGLLDQIDRLNEQVWDGNDTKVALAISKTTEVNKLKSERDADREAMRFSTEALEQLLACHDEPTCAAIDVALMAINALRARLGDV